MNKELNIGDYVRTIYGGFAKIIERKFVEEKEIIDFDEDIIPYYERMVDNCYKEELDKYIIKSSPNIIDLIEVGDYVNGCLVLFAGAVTWDNDGNILDKRVHINRSGNDFWLSDKFIETVVTKEQFESMKYKIGE